MQFESGRFMVKRGNYYYLYDTLGEVRSDDIEERKNAERVITGRDLFDRVADGFAYTGSVDPQVIVDLDKGLHQMQL